MGMGGAVGDALTVESFTGLFEIVKGLFSSRRQDIFMARIVSCLENVKVRRTETRITGLRTPFFQQHLVSFIPTLITRHIRTLRQTRIKLACNCATFTSTFVNVNPIFHSFR